MPKTHKGGDADTVKSDKANTIPFEKFGQKPSGEKPPGGKKGKVPKLGGKKKGKLKK
jgi:hypothetical protein